MLDSFLSNAGQYMCCSALQEEGFIVRLAFVVATTFACTLAAGRESPVGAAPVQPPALALVGVSSPDAAAAPEQAKRKVARIVFVGKKNACPCTRKSIDAGKKALQAVLGNKSQYRVQELNFDVDADRDQINALREKRAMVALPAIYFLDSAGEVVELLQGDVTEAKIRAVLK